MPWELSARLLAGMLALGLGEGRCRHQEECARSVSITLETTLNHPTQLRLPRVKCTECGPQVSGRGSRGWRWKLYRVGFFSRKGTIKSDVLNIGIISLLGSEFSVLTGIQRLYAHTQW